MADPPTMEPSVPLPSPDGADASIHLCPSSDPAAGPFALLGGDGASARVYAGEFRSSGGSLVRRLALKIQRPRPLEAALPGGAAPANPAIEDDWRRELAAYARLDGRGVTPDWFALQPPGGDPRPRPPLVYCRHRRVLFPPRDPVTAEVLADCRDDALLAAQSLPTYSGSSRRFLHSPKRSASGDPRFWTDQSVAPGGPASLKPSTELYAEWAGLISRKAETEASGAAADLARTFPCWTCPDAGECYPDGKPGKVTERMAEFCFQEFHLLAAERMPIGFDALCDLLGGAPAEGGRPAPARLFAQDDAGLEMAEIFALKLHAFHEAVRAAAGFVATLKAPHLNLNPRHVLADLPEGGGPLPAMWHFRVRLIDPAGAPSAVTTDDARLLLPPRRREAAYTHPIIGDRFGTLETGDLEIREANPAAADDGNAEGRVILVGRLRGEALRPGRLRPADRLRVLVRTADTEPVPVWFRIAEGQNAGTADVGAVPVISEPFAPPPALRAALAGTGDKPPLRGVRYAVFPVLGPPCDLHSLGMLLIRALLVNSRQELPGVMFAVGKVQSALVQEFAKRPADRAAVIRWMTEFLPASPVGPALDARNLGWTGEERPNAVPDAFWIEALVLAFGLITPGLAFSVCRDHADFDPANPAAKFDDVLAAVRTLSAKVHTLLFLQQTRNAEVASTIRELMSNPLESAEPAAVDGIDLVSRLSRCIEKLEGNGDAGR